MMELKPCPKCGHEVDVVVDRSQIVSHYSVVCDNCGTCSAEDNIDQFEAIRLWNEGEVNISKNALFDIDMSVGFREHFFVWAPCKTAAERKIEEAIEEGKVQFTYIAPGSLSFNNWGYYDMNYDPERYRRDVLNPEEAVEK